ncbi:MAG: SDR family NAD(P)-dependent oxidoreductase, partial [Halioglobus sp.]|nr:SDR family NAD(P)-dependent oxidoreductase [Halioglobus sp.]
MHDKHVAITGPTAGIGRATCLELARQGARLTLFCRSPAKAEALTRELAAVSEKPPRVILMDMASLDSVRNAAQTF